LVFFFFDSPPSPTNSQSLFPPNGAPPCGFFPFLPSSNFPFSIPRAYIQKINRGTPPPPDLRRATISFAVSTSAPFFFTLTSSPQLLPCVSLLPLSRTLKRLFPTVNPLVVIPRSPSARRSFLPTTRTDELPIALTFSTMSPAYRQLAPPPPQHPSVAMTRSTSRYFHLGCFPSPAFFQPPARASVLHASASGFSFSFFTERFIPAMEVSSSLGSVSSIGAPCGAI